ncbi:MAG: glycosyltransferase [Puniceicoccaceae bacterium]
MIKRRYIFIASTVDVDLGGIARSVPALASSVADAMLQLDDNPGAEVILLAPMTSEDTLSSAAISPNLQIRLCDGFNGVRHELERLTEPGEPVGFLYHAGVWNRLNYSVSATGKRKAIPVITSTRSMLDPWALNHRKLKKRIAWWSYAKQALASSALIHATAELEAEHIRNVLKSICPPIVTIPNGVHIPSGEEKAAPGGAENKRILFLSRIHPKKGLMDLIETFGQLNQTDWELVVAGNDDGGHQAECEHLAAKQVNAEKIHFIGPVSDEAKWDIYRSADLFVLPSYSENFGIVIGEALGMGVPVITTKATPWERLAEKRCGWWIETGVEPLMKSLKEAMAMSDEERREIGAHGSVWIREEFSWEAIGRQFVEAVGKFIPLK